ncbi:MAG TPA: TonB-dependent copper receptor [Luteimonas sp.]|nr:TonB-dependent copper receptor [Luteimonas sp.]HRO25927.1 TonB-dependent copper receptor [Luteimonas sp.]HRP73037.1 TonB-dependent copper receptor [Luteimonas sp.]
MSIPPRATLRASRLCMAIAAVSILSAPAAVAAADESTLPEPETLDPVVVIAQAPVSPLTWVTDPTLPRQPVPASDGADYLKTIPGFTAVRNGGSNGDPVLRGMFGSRLNLVTNEGAMPGACPSRMDNPLSYVSPDTFDRLVVVKGPQTVLWGPGASAGTVRFEREVERFDAPGARVSGSLLFGAFGRNDQVANLEAGAPSGYVRVNGNRSESDDYDDGDGNPVPSSWKKWNVDVALGWTPDDDTLLELSAGSGDGEARYAGRGMDGAQFKREGYVLRFEKTGLPGALASLQASAFHNRADHVMDNYTLRDPNPMGPMPMPIASNVERRTYGGRAALDWQWSQWALTAGADTQDSRHRGRNAMGRGAYRARPWTTDAEFDNLGAFAELTRTLASGGQWIAGARVDRAEVTDLRTTAGMMGMPNPTAGVTRRETLPAGFVRIEQTLPDTALTWYAGVGHTRRMPDYWELFSANMGPMGAANAFAGIAPERTTQLDVGAQFRGRRVDAWLSAYAGRVDDYILFTYRTGGMMGTMSSVANVDARIRGGEAGIEFRPDQRWTLGGTLAYAWGENRSSGEALPQMPPLDAKLSATWDDRRWSFGVLLRAVASQDRVSPEQGNVVGRDLGPSAGFATLAINGGYRFSERLRLSAGIDNLFDRSYSEHLNLAGSADFGFPADPVRIHEPGRTLWLRLNLVN